MLLGPFLAEKLDMNAEFTVVVCLHVTRGRRRHLCGLVLGEDFTPGGSRIIAHDLLLSCKTTKEHGLNLATS